MLILMETIPRNFLGICTCLIMLQKMLSVQCATRCVISTPLIANCNGKQLDTIPQDLDPEITSLDLSDNYFTEMRETSFNRYQKLTSLIIKNVLTDITKVDLFLFRPLKNLKVLDLSGSINSSLAYFYWPENLKILSIDFVGMDDIDVSHLKYLEELRAKGNQLFEFPTIHKLAPLSLADLDGNPMESLSAENLAPFCKLQKLGLLFPDDALVHNLPRFCICSRINIWIHSFRIQAKPLACYSPKPDYGCEETFSDEILSKYIECTERNAKKRGFIFYLFVALLLACVCGAVAYYAIKIKSVEETSTEQTTALNQSVEPGLESEEKEMIRVSPMI